MWSRTALHMATLISTIQSSMFLFTGFTGATKSTISFSLEFMREIVRSASKSRDLMPYKEEGLVRDKKKQKTREARASKHLRRWGWTMRGSFVSDRISRRSPSLRK